MKWRTFAEFRHSRYCAGRIAARAPLSCVLEVRVPGLTNFRSCEAGAATVDWVMMLVCIGALALGVLYYVFSGLAPTLEVIEGASDGFGRSPADR